MADELFLKLTIGDMIASFAHSVEERTGRPFKDFKWPNKLIYFHLVNQRADIYYQTRKQNRLEGNYEDYNEVLPCVAMQEVDMVECPCAPASGCTFMKSVFPMPKFISGMPTSITTLTGLDRYDYVEWSMFKYEINNRITAANKSMLFTLQTIFNDQWLYTYITREADGIPMKAKFVKVAGVPIDPMEIALYPICGERKKDECNILDLQFIIEKRLINLLFDSTYRKLITMNNSTQIGDTKNDDRNAATSADPRF